MAVGNGKLIFSKESVNLKRIARIAATMTKVTNPQTERAERHSAVDMPAATFRDIGHKLVDQLADLMSSLPQRPVTPAEQPSDLRKLIGAPSLIPMEGSDPKEVVAKAAKLLMDHSLYNSHPRFWGYITAGPAPIGILADLLAAGVNPNCGGWKLSPIASEIESQSIRWIADLIGYSTSCGGILVSGGNMANFVGFLSARAAKAPWDVRAKGHNDPDAKRMTAYVSAETHTWIQKATDLFGLGTNSVRWIPTDKKYRMDTNALKAQIEADRAAGSLPFLVVGTAGSVSTGAVDPLYEIAAICRKYDLWFHVDGAYGGFAAKVNGVPTDLKGISEADSLAVDPHKWLYMPLEVGCALVKRPEAMINAFSYHPPYYHFEDERINFVDYGMQNSRGFRALKVWLALQQVGRAAYLKTLEEDIRLSQEMFRAAAEETELETFTQGLSIATFRFVPENLRSKRGEAATEEYLNKLNEEIMLRIERSGEAFVSHAILEGKFVLRACIVNFRTTAADVRAFPKVVCRFGRETDAAMR
ncbi:MAG: aminotransferase class V-fold PLP-dependent enzyme [candidate division Zixibacteria bacterium]|nr:aminotransferase class V-fold PLP-dependent enzyme [candidate division Zixibacteria bacterium]